MKYYITFILGVIGFHVLLGVCVYNMVLHYVFVLNH